MWGGERRPGRGKEEEGKRAEKKCGDEKGDDLYINLRGLAGLGDEANGSPLHSLSPQILRRAAESL